MKRLTKNHIIFLLSMICIIQLISIIDWQISNDRMLQKVVDTYMQNIADLEQRLDQLQSSYDRKCRDIANLKNKVRELETQPK